MQVFFKKYRENIRIKVGRNKAVLAKHRTSCVIQCYTICAYILYSIVNNPQMRYTIRVYYTRAV